MFVSVFYTSLLSFMLRYPIAWSIITICTDQFSIPTPLSLDALPSSKRALIKLVFRGLGTRVKNNKFCDGDCTAHVQELTVVHDVEHMQTRSSSLSLTRVTEEREPGNEAGTYDSFEIKERCVGRSKSYLTYFHLDN